MDTGLGRRQISSEYADAAQTEPDRVQAFARFQSGGAGRDKTPVKRILRRDNIAHNMRQHVSQWRAPFSIRHGSDRHRCGRGDQAEPDSDGGFLAFQRWGAGGQCAFQLDFHNA
jgi:hypothetical protein